MDLQFQDAWPLYVNGNRNAFGTVYSAAHPRLTLFCLGLTRDEEIAKNIASETLLKLMEQTNPREILNPASWLLTVARNSCNTWWTTNNRRAEILDDVKEQFSGVTRPVALEQLENESHVKLIRESLDTIEWQIWQLHLDGYDNKEIAEQTLLAEKTVANKKTAARNKLRQAFAHES